MNRPFLDLKEATGRVVETMRVYDDPPYGREVYIEFTDGTKMSVDIGIETIVCAKHYTDQEGDLKVLAEHHQRSSPDDVIPLTREDVGLR